MAEVKGQDKEKDQSIIKELVNQIKTAETKKLDKQIIKPNKHKDSVKNNYNILWLGLLGLLLIILLKQLGVSGYYLFS